MVTPGFPGRTGRSIPLVVHGVPKFMEVLGEEVCERSL